MNKLVYELGRKLAEEKIAEKDFSTVGRGMLPTKENALRNYFRHGKDSNTRQALGGLMGGLSVASLSMLPMLLLLKNPSKLQSIGNAIASKLPTALSSGRIANMLKDPYSLAAASGLAGIPLQFGGHAIGSAITAPEKSIWDTPREELGMAGYKLINKLQESLK